MSLIKPHRLVIGIVFLLSLTVACANPKAGSEHADAETTKPSSESEEQGEGQHHEGEERGGGEEHEEHEEGVVELTPEAASRIDIRTALAEERILAAELTTTGQVDFDQTRLAHVSPRISGRVHRVRAALGEDVRAGQTLAELDSIELGQAKAAYLQAKAKVELASKSFDRAQSLLADRIASEQEVLETEAEFREATAALHTAEETLHLYGLSQSNVDSLTYDDQAASIYPLRAPFAGTIVELHATLGELVTPERNLVTLADLSRLWIWIDIYQRDLGGVHLEDQARARVDAFPGEIFTGTVSFLSARVDADTRTVRARLDVENRAGKLRPGMFVEVGLVDPHMKGGREAQVRSLVIPEGAVVRDGDGFLVFISAGENRFARRQIRVGRKAGGYVEVLNGVELGDSVVVEGAFLLKSAASKESLGGGHDH